MESSPAMPSSVHDCSPPEEGVPPYLDTIPLPEDCNPVGGQPSVDADQPSVDEVPPSLDCPPPTVDVEGDPPVAAAQPLDSPPLLVDLNPPAEANLAPEEANLVPVEANLAPAEVNLPHVELPPLLGAANAFNMAINGNEGDPFLPQFPAPYMQDGPTFVTCHICRIWAHSKVLLTTCGHLYHDNCLQRWVAWSGQKSRKLKLCPTCGGHFDMSLNKLFHL